MTRGSEPFRESELLGRIAARAAGLRLPGLEVGPGDDCAVVEVAPGVRWLLTVDQVVVGKHVTVGTPLASVARKAIARSVSDVAAMAGVPRWSLVSGMLPLEMPQAEADELCVQLHQSGIALGAPVIGGDIAAGERGAPLSLSVTVIGEMPGGEAPVLRSGARVGDGVYVTGTLGGSFEAGSGGGKHLTFVPRVAEGRALRAALGERLHAMMDVSDGLGRDGSRLAAASGVRLSIDSVKLPMSAACKTWKNAVADGEDYELLFTASGVVPDEVAGTRVTRIGEVVAGSGCWCKIPDGVVVDISAMGWDHHGGGGADLGVGGA